MLDLQALPEDLRDKVIDKMFDACCDMGQVELRAMRLVCVRLAATFYKRCIMTVMLTRYKPFRFAVTYSVPHTGGIAQYDLHAHYPNPCSLPKEGWDLYDWRGLYDYSDQMCRDGLDQRSVVRLGMDHLHDAYAGDGWRFIANNHAVRWQKEQRHRNDLHWWLTFDWEASLFSIAPRPADGARIEGLEVDDANVPRSWPWL